MFDHRPCLFTFKTSSHVDVVPRESMHITHSCWLCRLSPLVWTCLPRMWFWKFIDYSLVLSRGMIIGFLLFVRTKINFEEKKVWENSADSLSLFRCEQTFGYVNEYIIISGLTLVSFILFNKWKMWFSYYHAFTRVVKLQTLDFVWVKTFFIEDRVGTISKFKVIQVVVCPTVQ